MRGRARAHDESRIPLSFAIDSVAWNERRRGEPPLAAPSVTRSTTAQFRNGSTTLRSAGVRIFVIARTWI